jgi:ABC-type dipeptide/oligopeptide/nickel transport system permease component
MLFVEAVVEYVFQIPGIGYFFCRNIVSFPEESGNGVVLPPSRDFAPIIAFMMIFLTLMIVCTLITDVAYAWIDPRIRQSDT